MMLTREQAAATWCPMVRLTACTSAGEIQNGQTVFNRVELGGDPAPKWPTASGCIADKCAMWRWAGVTDIERMDMDEGRLTAVELLQRPARGYCGLAGAPRGAA